MHGACRFDLVDGVRYLDTTRIARSTSNDTDVHKMYRLFVGIGEAGQLFVVELSSVASRGFGLAYSSVLRVSAASWLPVWAGPAMLSAPRNGIYRIYVMITLDLTRQTFILRVNMWHFRTSRVSCFA